MSQLDKEIGDLDDAVKRHLEINPGLESVLGRKEVKAMTKAFRKAMIAQVKALLKTDIFDQIEARIHTTGKADPIPTESDELEVRDVVEQNIEPLDKHDVSDAFVDFLIIIFNFGGQDFLNKHNIPATFELTNEPVKNRVKANARQTIKGVDDTTIKWVSDQIMEGRASGLAPSQIADKIRDAVPQTYEGRAERIVRTETSYMVGESEHITAKNNGASHKEWVTVGSSACDICQENEMAGQIGIGEAFPSGDLQEPAHPNCMCVVEYVFTPFMGTIWHGQ